MALNAPCTRIRGAGSLESYAAYAPRPAGRGCWCRVTRKARDWHGLPTCHRFDVMEHAARNAQPLRVGPQGRVVIPAALRNALGFRPGDTVVAWTEGDRLILRSRKAVEDELLAMFQHVQGSMAEELIQERRAEAAREARD